MDGWINEWLAIQYLASGIFRISNFGISRCWLFNRFSFPPYSILFEFKSHPWSPRILSIRRHHSVALMVKNLPEVQETQVWSLGQEDPLEKGMATHSSVLAWRIPWTEEPGGLQSTGSQSPTQLSNDNTFNTDIQANIPTKMTLLVKNNSTSPGGRWWRLRPGC